MNAPSDAAIYERARRLASNAMWTISLQRRRLKTKEPEDQEFVFRLWADFQFFIVALTRLRRAAQLATKAPVLRNAVRQALVDFDAVLPMLKPMRDAAEHIDDYAMDQGRNSTVSRGSLEVWASDETTFHWLNYELNTDTALSAALQLFQAIQHAKSLLPSQMP